MFVSNLTNRSLGLASPIVLRPNEVNRFIDDDNIKLVESVWRAKAANLVSVSETKGLVKTIAAKAVKTLTFDAGAIYTEPRSSGKRVEEVKKVLPTEAENTVKDEVTISTKAVEEPVVEETVEETVEEVAEVAEVVAKEDAEENTTEESVADTKKSKKSKK